MAKPGSTGGSAQRAMPAGWRTWLAVGVIAGLAIVAYHNSFAVPFVFDDDLAIVANPSLRQLSTAWWPSPDVQGLPVSGRPVVNFSFGVNYALGGFSVWSYHAINLLVHAITGWVLFGVVRRTLLQPRLAPRFGSQAFELALVTAALWTVHPLQTESVTYISQRAEALLGLWFLLTLWCSIRAREQPAARWWIGAAVAACVLGMTTKEVMVSAPLLVALYDRTFVTGSWRATWRERRGLLLALAGTWLVLGTLLVVEGGRRGQSAGFGLGVSAWHYLLTQCEAIVLYLKLAFWPHPLVLDYGTAVTTSIGAVWWQAAIILGLLAGTGWSLVRCPAVGFVGAWFFLILAPTSSVLPLVGQTIAEHRMYLPLAAVIVLTVLAIFRVGRHVGLVATAGIALVLLVMTVRRNAEYESAIAIVEDTVAKRPDNARAMALLASYHHRAGDIKAARTWLERSLALDPAVPPVLNNLGNVWLELGDANKAAGFFQQALDLMPHDPVTLNNLGNALVLAGRGEEGIRHLEAALRLAPDATMTRGNLARALARGERYAEAAVHFEAVLQGAPDDITMLEDSAAVLQELGRDDEAIRRLTRAVRLEPKDPDRQNRLGVILARRGRISEALVHFQEALRFNPAHEAAQKNAVLAQRRLDGN